MFSTSLIIPNLTLNFQAQVLVDHTTVLSHSSVLSIGTVELVLSVIQQNVMVIANDVIVGEEFVQE